MILLCWQNLANQIAEQAKFLRRAGEGLQLTADQALQLEKMASLEKSSQEQSKKVMLLEAQVEALEQDNSALKDKASKLQDKVFFFLLLSPLSSCFLFSYFPSFDST